MMAVRLVSITTDLHSLCIKGDLKTINESWTKYSDQLENCKSGFTPLHEAARKGHTGIVEFLISKGARVNALSKKKETALYYAAGGKHTECEIVLIDNKANVRIGEITPLGSEDGEFIKMLTFQAFTDHTELPSDELINRGLESAMKLENIRFMEKLVMYMPTNLKKIASEAEAIGKNQAAAFLLLTQAAITNNLELVERLYSLNKTGSALSPAIRKIAFSISTRIPLMLAKQLKHVIVFDLILTKTGFKRSRSSIDISWDNLGIDHLSATILSHISLISFWSLSHNELQTLDCYGVDLSKLRVLDASHNQISSVDPELFEMPRLISLNLSNNRLSILPKFKKGSNLTRLDLSNNKFDQIPYPLVNCTSLSYLNLSYNQILRLPEWLASVENLDDVRLEGVPLVKADDKRDYLKTKQLLKVKLDNTSKVNEMKVIVAGPSKIGKIHFTSLLCKENSEIAGHNEIEYKKELFVRSAAFENSNEQGDYRFNVWEIRGLNLNSTVAIEKLVYTKYTIYAIVFDISMADTEINKLWDWLNAISTIASPSCVLFLGYKSNLNALLKENPVECCDSKVAKVLLTPLVKHFSETLIFSDDVVFSFSEHSQLQNIVDAMHKTASVLNWTDGQPYLGRLIRNTAVAFKEEMEVLCKLKKVSPVMLLDDMQALTSHYKNFQISEPKEIAKISSFLNDVGLILLFSPSVVPYHFLSVCDLDWFLHTISHIFTDITQNSPDVSIGARPDILHSSFSVGKEWIVQKLLSSSIFTSTLKHNPTSNLDVTLIINAIITILVDNKLLLRVPDKLTHQFILPSHLEDRASKNLLQLLPNVVPRVRWKYTVEKFLPRQTWIEVIDSILKQVVLDNDIPVQIWRNSFVFEEHNLAILYSTSELSITLLSVTVSGLFKQVRGIVSEILRNAIVEIMCPKCLEENKLTPAEFLFKECMTAVTHSNKLIKCQFGHKVLLSTIVPHHLVTSTALNLHVSPHIPKQDESCRSSCYEINTLRKAIKCLKNAVDFERVHDKSILIREYPCPCLSSSVGIIIDIHVALNTQQSTSSQFSEALLTYITPPHGVLSQLRPDHFDGFVSHIVVFRIAVQLAYAIRIAPSLTHYLKNVLLWSLNAESAFNCSFAIKSVYDPKLILMKRRVDCWKFYVKNLVAFAKSAVSKSSNTTLIAKYHALEKLLIDSDDGQIQQDLDQLIKSLSKIENQLLSNVVTISDPAEFSAATAHCVFRVRHDDVSENDSLTAPNKNPEVWLPQQRITSTTMKLAVFKPDSMTLKVYPIQSLNPKRILAVKVCSANVWMSSMLDDDLSCLSIFDANSRMIVHNVKMKNNAFTCFAEFPEMSRMYLGTKAGFLFDFPSDVEKIKSQNSKPRHKRISENEIVNLVIFEQQLWISTSDNRIYLLQCSWNLSTPMLKEFWLDEINPSIAFTNLVSSNGISYSYDHKSVCFINPKLQGHSETVAYYNDTQNSIIISEVTKQISPTNSEAVISSLTEANGCLWIGLSSGHILIFHRNKLIYHMQPYDRPVISLCPVSFVLQGVHEVYVLSCGKSVNVPSFASEGEDDVLMFWYAPSPKVLSQMILLENSNGCYLETFRSLADMIKIGDFNDKLVLQLVEGGSVQTSLKVSEGHQHSLDKAKTLEPSVKTSSSWGTVQLNLQSEEIIDIDFTIRPTFQMLLDEVTIIVGPCTLQLGYRLRQHKMLVSVSSEDELNCYLELFKRPPLLII